VVAVAEHRNVSASCYQKADQLEVGSPGIPSAAYILCMPSFYRLVHSTHPFGGKPTLSSSDVLGDDHMAEGCEA
jgi:hypothetical protein